MVGADGVPDALDAPIQRIKLRDLGYLAHLLGFTSVSINIPERQFLALSTRGTISIIDIPTLRKAVRFEGDILDFYTLVSRNSPLWAFRAAALINGRISFGKYIGNGLYLPLETLAQALIERWSSDQFDHSLREVALKGMGHFSIGPLWREAWTLMTIMEKLRQIERNVEKDTRVIHRMNLGCSC
jgi:hypothetical protein